MSNPETFYKVKIRYHVQIPMRDGLALSADLFMPVTKGPDDRFPVILEMLPYRKADWRYRADHQRMTYLAQRGYVGCRLDIRGTGNSPGIAMDEYTEIETQDGYDAVEWLAAQSWCNGKVGMWGISYGGFTAIQPDGSLGWSKSSAGSWVMPSRAITAWERVLGTEVNDTISSRSQTSKPKAKAARAASVA
jgi:hypothetical protein